MPSCGWKCVPTASSSGVDISEVPIFVTTDDFSVRFAKITERITHELMTTFLILTYF